MKTRLKNQGLSHQIKQESHGQPYRTRGPHVYDTSVAKTVNYSTVNTPSLMSTFDTHGSVTNISDSSVDRDMNSKSLLTKYEAIDIKYTHINFKDTKIYKNNYINIILLIVVNNK